MVKAIRCVERLSGKYRLVQLLKQIVCDPSRLGEPFQVAVCGGGPGKQGRCFIVDNISKIPYFNLPRIDAPGALHHIVIRGIERKAIFEDDKDRDAFIERLSKLLQEMDADAIGRYRSVRGHRRCVPSF